MLLATTMNKIQKSHVIELQVERTITGNHSLLEHKSSDEGGNVGIKNVVPLHVSQGFPLFFISINIPSCSPEDPLWFPLTGVMSPSSMVECLYLASLLPTLSLLHLFGMGGPFRAAHGCAQE